MNSKTGTEHADSSVEIKYIWYMYTLLGTFGPCQSLKKTNTPYQWKIYDLTSNPDYSTMKLLRVNIKTCIASQYKNMHHSQIRTSHYKCPQNANTNT